MAPSSRDGRRVLTLCGLGEHNRPMKTIVAFLFAILVFSTFPAEAQRRQARVVEKPSRLSYDLSASAGSYNGSSYTEINLGLNWFLQDWLNWRNSIFTRQGGDLPSVQGLDSGLRLSTSLGGEDGGPGLDAFAGPGVRFASNDNNAVFGEAGVIFKVGGLRLGLGAKALNYVSSRKDSNGLDLPKSDTQYFLILSGGGVL